MGVRILGGLAKNFEIKTPRSFMTRPTLSLLKRKIFDRYQDWSKFRIYDLFGGTGSIAFEAASRGCELVNIYETNSKAYKLLLENRKRLQSMYKLGEINIYPYSCLKEDNFIESKEKENIYYIDPPFNHLELYSQTFNLLRLNKGIFMIEGDDQKTGSAKDFLDQFKFLQSSMVKVYQKGSHFILVCKTE